MDQFPPNSAKSKQTAPPPQEKKLEPVVQGAKRRKKPLGKQFRETFLSGDGKSAGDYVFRNVLIPAARDTLYQAGSQLIERIIFGDSRQRRTPGMSGHATGHVQYDKVRTNSPPPSGMSSRARATHNFDEIILDNRGDAEHVLEQLMDVVDQYDQASVADLYFLVGERADHTDHKWGWTDLRGARVMPMRGGGYLLDLPRPEPLQ